MELLTAMSVQTRNVIFWKSEMHEFARLVHFVAKAALLCVAVLTQPAFALAKSPPVDFKLLYQAAKIANQAYDGRSKVLAEGNAIGPGVQIGVHNARTVEHSS